MHDKVFTEEEYEVLLKARNILLVANMGLTPNSEEFMKVGRAYHSLAELIGYPDED